MFFFLIEIPVWLYVRVFIVLGTTTRDWKPLFPQLRAVRKATFSPFPARCKSLCRTNYGK